MFCLNACTDYFRLVAALLQCLNNLILMFRSVCLHCNTKFYGCISVDGYELIMFQFNDIAALFCNDIGNSGQLSRLIGKQPDTWD